MASPCGGRRFEPRPGEPVGVPPHPFRTPPAALLPEAPAPRPLLRTMLAHKTKHCLMLNLSELLKNSKFLKKSNVVEAIDQSAGKNGAAWLAGRVQCPGKRSLIPWKKGSDLQARASDLLGKRVQVVHWSIDPTSFDRDPAPGKRVQYPENQGRSPG
jgi:hypothetical protein